MPKLQDQTVAQNQCKIEAAARRVFTRQGFHGTSVREIAREAGVSIGNLYNYYPTKEDLFVAVVNRYEAKMNELRQKAFGPIADPFSTAELLRLSKVIQEFVYDNPDYWRLMYIDVIEFGSRHFAPTFRSLAENIKQRLGPRLEAATRRGPWRGINPALAFTAIYLQLVTYFLVEKLFGGRQHLGLPDDRAVAQLIWMASKGLWRDTGRSASRKRRKRQ